METTRGLGFMGYMRIVEKKVEISIYGLGLRGYIEILEKNMETIKGPRV